MSLKCFTKVVGIAWTLKTQCIVSSAQSVAGFQ